MMGVTSCQGTLELQPSVLFDPEDPMSDFMTSMQRRFVEKPLEKPLHLENIILENGMF